MSDSNFLYVFRTLFSYKPILTILWSGWFQFFLWSPFPHVSISDPWAHELQLQLVLQSPSYFAIFQVSGKIQTFVFIFADFYDPMEGQNPPDDKFFPSCQLTLVLLLTGIEGSQSSREIYTSNSFSFFAKILKIISGRTYLYPTYRSNRTVQSFTMYYYYWMELLVLVLELLVLESFNCNELWFV